MRPSVHVRAAGLTLSLLGLGLVVGLQAPPAAAADDVFAPTAAPRLSPSPNFNDWNRTNVTVNWRWTDEAGGSGIDAARCTTSTLVSTAGESTVTATCRDLAGNEGSASVTVRIDKTAPVASPAYSPAPNAAGWNNTPAAIDWNWTESGGSDIQACLGRTEESLEGIHQLTAFCLDFAGNFGSAAGVLRIDMTAPTNVTGAPVSAPDGTNGWYRTPVSVGFTGSDSLSGIGACSSVTYAGPDSASAAVSGSCTDVAGNPSAAAGSVAFPYDATVPTLAPVVSPAVVSRNGVVTASANADDATSGVASEGCDAPDTSSPGTWTVTCRATDNAGNTASATATYTVVDSAPTIVVAPGGACLSDTSADGTINLAVGDPDTGADGLVLGLVGNSNPALVPSAGVAFGGSGADRTLRVTAAPRMAGAAGLTVEVSDGVNTTTLLVTVIVASARDETLDGTAGTDLMFGSVGRNTLNGFEAIDLLCGGNADDTLNGGDGDDTLVGGRGADALDGGSGDDLLTGGLGGDSFLGGPDADTVTDFRMGEGDVKDGTTE